MTKNKTFFTLIASLLIISSVSISILLIKKQEKQSKEIIPTEYNCQKGDKMYVLQNGMSLNLEPFNNLFKKCYNSDITTKGYEYMTSTRLYYVGFGDIFFNKDNQVQRIDISLPAPINFDNRIEEVKTKESFTYAYATGRVRGEYIAYVWLEKGYTLITYKDVKGNTYISGISKFNKNEYNEDQYKQIFIESPETKIEISMLEI